MKSVKELTHDRSLILSWHMLAYLLTNSIVYFVYSFCTGFKMQSCFRTLNLGQPCGLSSVNSINSNLGLVLRTVKKIGIYCLVLSRLEKQTPTIELEPLGRKYGYRRCSGTAEVLRIVKRVQLIKPDK